MNETTAVESRGSALTISVTLRISSAESGSMGWVLAVAGRTMAASNRTAIGAVRIHCMRVLIAGGCSPFSELMPVLQKACFDAMVSSTKA
jgi:hypothetical protein